jgi:hypothetical protein
MTGVIYLVNPKYMDKELPGKHPFAIMIPFQKGED